MNNDALSAWHFRQWRLKAVNSQALQTFVRIHIRFARNCELIENNQQKQND